MGWPLIEKRLVSSGMRPRPWVERTEGERSQWERDRGEDGACLFHRGWSFRSCRIYIRGILDCEGELVLNDLKRVADQRCKGE